MGISFRPLEFSDIPDFVRVASLEALVHRLPHTLPYTREQAEAVWERTQNEAETYRVFSIEYDGRYAGTLNTRLMPSNKHAVQFGYWIDPQFQQRGIGTEIVRQFCAAPTYPDIIRFQALVEPDNVPSMKVLQRNGFEREGLLRSYYFKQGKPIDVVMLARIELK